MARWGVSHFNIDETDKILDIGCGGGKNLERFAKQIGKDGCVVGIDYSEVSVEKSTDLNKQAIDDGKVKVLQGSVSEMPFEDESFDIVTGFETIYFWPDFINDLKEVNRVLKKDGLVFFCNEAVYREGIYLLRFFTIGGNGHVEGLKFLHREAQTDQFCIDCAR